MIYDNLIEKKRLDNMRWEIRKKEEELKQKLACRKQMWFTIFIISKYYTKSLHLYRIV